MLFHNRKTFFIILSLVVLIVTFFSNQQSNSEQLGDINHADTAWMIVASALVLLMTPGLAFFYGGMVSKKNVISTMLQSFIALGVISLVWVLFGFSFLFDFFDHNIPDFRAFLELLHQCIILTDL